MMSDMLTVKDAAERLGVSSETLRRLYKSGELRGRPKTSARGSPILIEKTSVEKYIAKLEAAK